MRKAVLTWLYSQEKQKAVAKPFVLTGSLTDITELSIKPMKRLRAEADKLYQDSLMTGLKSISAELGVAVDMDIVATPEAIDFLSKKTMRITKVGNTVNRQVGQAIIQGIDKAETIDQIANRVKHVFNVGSKRAKTIARTETFGAINFGRHEAIKQTRFQRVKWFTALDERVRSKHIGMHGETKGIGEMWNVAGESLEYPGDPAGSAGNIVNCRCIEIVDLDAALKVDPNRPQVPQEDLKSLKETNGFDSVSDNRVSGAMSKCYS
jgi:SPP1 gp7 family putative phage head morphogenesis protein